jgi:Sulfotransferase domain
MSLKVIGAGFGRTGTRSLKEALEILDLGPCHHMVEVFTHPEQAAFWTRVADGEPVDWNEVFASYRSSCDWPSCSFYRELAEFYPEAKVVLTLRDPKAWYRSVANTIMAHLTPPKPGEPEIGPGRFARVLIAEKTFGSDMSEAHMIEVYNRHNEEVVRTIPPGRLLVFDTKDGWAPLCEFLKVPVPDVAFPLLNTTEQFQQHVRDLRTPQAH